MSRKINISRILVCIFVLSGVAEFAMDYAAARVLPDKKQASDERPEFQRFLKSNSLPLAEIFSRTKTEAESEKEVGGDVLRFIAQNFIVPEALGIVAKASGRNAFVSPHQPPKPAFLLNRQFRI